MGVKGFLPRLFAADEHSPGRFLEKEERKQIQKKIKAIERDAHSKIVIHVIRNHKGDLYDRAVREFSRHKLFHRETKTGILLLISLKSRQFQLLGDEHIHEKLGEEGWSKLAANLGDSFKQGKYFEGILTLLDDLEGHLRAHFLKNETEGKDAGNP